MKVAKQKRAIALIFFFLFLSFISTYGLIASNAEDYGTFKNGQPINLVQTCGTCSYVNISVILSPSSEIILSNQGMNKSGDLFYYELSPQSLNGKYIVCGKADLSGTITDWCYIFNITPSGKAEDIRLEWGIIGGFILFIFLFMYLINRFKDDTGAIVIYGVTAGTISLLIVYGLANYYGYLEGKLFGISIITLGTALILYFYTVSNTFYKVKENKD